MIRIREIYRYIGIRKTLTTLGSSSTKLLLPSRLLDFSTRGERDTLFTMLTVPSDPTTCGASRRPNLTELALVQKSTLFVQPQISTNCFFSKSPRVSAHRFRTRRHSHPSLFPIWGFYYDICNCHILRARA